MVPITCNAVGDILALAMLVLDVIRALNDAKGSASEYRVSVDELNGLRTILAAAARVAQDSVDGGCASRSFVKLINAVGTRRMCSRAWSTFLL